MLTLSRFAALLLSTPAKVDPIDPEAAIAELQRRLTPEQFSDFSTYLRGLSRAASKFVPPELGRPPKPHVVEAIECIETALATGRDIYWDAVMPTNMKDYCERRSFKESIRKHFGGRFSSRGKRFILDGADLPLRASQANRAEVHTWPGKRDAKLPESHRRQGDRTREIYSTAWAVNQIQTDARSANFRDDR